MYETKRSKKMGKEAKQSRNVNKIWGNECKLIITYLLEQRNMLNHYESIRNRLFWTAKPQTGSGFGTSESPSAGKTENNRAGWTSMYDVANNPRCSLTQKKKFILRRGLTWRCWAIGRAVVGDEALHLPETGGLSKAYITKCEVFPSLFPHLDPD